MVVNLKRRVHTYLLVENSSGDIISVDVLSGENGGLGDKVLAVFSLCGSFTSTELHRRLLETFSFKSEK